MKKKDMEIEDKWKIDEAIESLMRYQKIISDEKMKEKVRKELKERASKMKETANEM